MFNSKMIFETITDRIRKNKFFLLEYFDKNFSNSDSKKWYQENLKTQPADWHYRHKKVTYTLNSYGYRTDEFKNIDWANSIVVFGCSHVFGVGVADDETMPYYLSQITGYPVVNMGASGSSMTFALHSAAMLRDAYPTPKIVINMWTMYDRTTYYYKRETKHLGAWDITKNEYMDAWTRDRTHAEAHALMISKISKHMWSNTRYFEGSYIEETAKLLNCWYTGHIQDTARDLAHSGRASHYSVAEKIAKKLDLLKKEI